MHGKTTIVERSGVRASRRNLSMQRHRVAASLLVATAFTFAPYARADVACAWGWMNYAQGGFRSRPTIVLGDLTGDITLVAAGGSHSLAVRNGVAYAWGSCGHGQLGVGPSTDQVVALPVHNLARGVSAIAGGIAHSLAVQNGAMYAWGDNVYGQLGDGTTTDRYTPVAVNGLTSGVTLIAGGRLYSLAVQNGGLYAWGSNYSGELGDGTRTFRTEPVAVSGLSSDITAIAAGSYHSMAVQNGAVYAWGVNTEGELGDGTTTKFRSTPMPVIGLSSGVTAIAAGDTHSLAVRNGSVYAWGYNDRWQLGDGSTTEHNVPEQIDPNDLHDIIAVATSQASSFALSSDGSIWDWGENESSQLGLGSYFNREYRTPQHLMPPVGYVFTSINANPGGAYIVATAAATPEPASLSLIALATGALLARKRRRLASIVYRGKTDSNRISPRRGEWL